VARALTQAGAPVYGCDPDPLEIGHFSSLVRKDAGFSAEPDDERRLAGLLAFSEASAQRPVLFTAGDDQIEWVARHHPRLAPRFRLQDCARPEVALRYVDKREFYAFAATFGAELPVTHYPRNAEELAAIAADLRYPVILKPLRGHAWRKRLRGAKVIVAADAGELKREYARVSGADAELMVQEVIGGPEKNIAVAACAIGSRGQVLGVFTARKRRQFPYYYGSASCCTSEWLPQIADLSLTLLSRMGFRGVCGTEFKRDPRTGRWILIEINPRPTLWFDLARVAGVNLVEAAYRDLAGLPPAPVARQRDGVEWRYLARDWATCARYRMRRDADAPGLREILRLPESEAIASRLDPKATAAYPFYVLVHALRHLVPA
jgi:predicted ATP-grasp superfamily ATP-dependent carboligase